MKLLHSRQGLFGPITVTQDNDKRYLFINNELQGQVFLDKKTSEPSLQSASIFADAWLIPAFHNPIAEVLIVGLGAGAGVLHLLNHFPDIKITVVEIDPVMIEVAIKYFPLLNQFKDRLSIINQDICEFVETNNKVFNFTCLDAFNGTEVPAIVERDFYFKLMRFSDELWVNFIGNESDDYLRKIVEMDELIRCVFPLSNTNNNNKQNWVLTSRENFSDELMEFKAIERIIDYIPAKCFY